MLRIIVGGDYRNSPDPKCEGLQGTFREQTDDDNSSTMFAIDKGIRTEERELANTIAAREDRGLSNRKQEGTLICMKI